MQRVRSGCDWRPTPMAACTIASPMARPSTRAHQSGPTQLAQALQRSSFRWRTPNSCAARMRIAGCSSRRAARSPQPSRQQPPLAVSSTRLGEVCTLRCCRQCRLCRRLRLSCWAQRSLTTSSRGCLRSGTFAMLWGLRWRWRPPRCHLLRSPTPFAAAGPSTTRLRASCTVLYCVPSRLTLRVSRAGTRICTSSSIHCSS
mmetsp:Transcript_38827/g.90799  ORF Transcript_38827/g.90799 Transcript_38827/m.90799 type:complete len:201 (+) Transcript_38827:82-684(+)